MSEWLTLERLPDNDITLPTYASDHSAGVDFAACIRRPSYLVSMGGERIALPPAELLTFDPSAAVMVSLGFKCEFGEQYVLTLHVRSSVGLKGFLLANGTGIIDPDYRGELFACLYNRTNGPLTIEHGQRIVQGILLRFERPVVCERPVKDSERGEGGFGSTGR